MGERYTVPIECKSLGDVFRYILPVDARWRGQLDTDVDPAHTSYKVTLVVEWERERRVGPPWTVKLSDLGLGKAKGSDGPEGQVN